MKQSKKIALSGIISALSLTVMLLTGLFPFAEYALPALSGIILTVLVIELSKKEAFISYIAVSILSFFIVPSKEAALIFIFFLGYYPIIKSLIEHINKPKIEIILKLILFNVAVLIAYFVMINLLSMTELLSDFDFGFKYGMLIFLITANFVFLLYDYALTGAIDMYYRIIRPKIQRLF